ncbi:hypothetical protein M0R04_15080 [Candidatus Dojkabacteria bacterium]|jgi:hypothetical protein|nr:hypothetical protein [Candidatus Dojkabacteria bacterium]
MTAKLWETSTVNAFSSTLNGSITAGDSSIILTSVTGLVAPGVLTIDRQNTAGDNTPTIREYISFTGISVNTLTGCSRGVAGSTAQEHSSGAIVEENFSVSHWGDLLDFLAASHDSAGNIVASTATITTVRAITHLNASGASSTFSNVTIGNSLNISGASVTGNFPIVPVWILPGNASAATSSLGKPIDMPQLGVIDWASVVLRSPVSAASIIFDINKNGVSIFDAGTRLSILGAGTYASTASIATKTFNAGDVFTVDLDVGGSYADATVKFRAR